jgi:hypothetical protein
VPSGIQAVPGAVRAWKTSREWSTGLCGRFGWLTLTAPERFRLSLLFYRPTPTFLAAEGLRQVGPS